MNRPPVMAQKRGAVRSMVTTRPQSTRPSSQPHTNGRASPAESVVSTKLRSSPVAGVKRKEREFEEITGEETNINVVVRCRGRNDREVKENSGVVVSTDGVKGKVVELSMGPNAVSNKSYRFDKVFSSAADQAMVFDGVVAPILDEVLAGFNCTIFAYGQTGTGKTYTMSGEISDMVPLPDTAGIIPRVLHSLFGKLEKMDTETNVKCSFIELYNEELRDLLAADEGAKLKIFDDTNKKGQTSTMVQGMEEFHIKTASKGLELLRLGSHKRQVAATKCNDLSSRSHTVFTVTVYIKKATEEGEDYVSSAKLNLVDLAGSENIGRSGAENKRATEAGLINKSLLTLGRVINALVDKNGHIPYRESKLTRLLQDSLGGRTKTCIIATLSPAKTNLEETISTLDYAFRAKNIRNKPQMNQLVSKKTLIREFTSEIERLKSELIATRQRNGVYLTTDIYEELTTESESRRILSEEQRDKIETMEANLKNKTQELFQLTNNLRSMKEENESVQTFLESTQDVLQKTEVVLEHTKRHLEEETTLREAHQETEEQLARAGARLLSTLDRTTSDLGGLHSKLRRRSDLHKSNKAVWTSLRHTIHDSTESLQSRLREFENQHKTLLNTLSTRWMSHLEHEIHTATEAQRYLVDKTSAFENSESEIDTQTSRAREEMDAILEEVKTLKTAVKGRVVEGLASLGIATQKIAVDIVSGLEEFHGQLHSSYSEMGKEFKHTFDDLTSQLNKQRAESEHLRHELAQAGLELIEANTRTSKLLKDAVQEEKAKAAADRLDLMSQISQLVQGFGTAQDQRLDSKLDALQCEIDASNVKYRKTEDTLAPKFNALKAQSQAIVDSVLRSREHVKLKIKRDWSLANERNKAMQASAASVYDATSSQVALQTQGLDDQLGALDDIMVKVQGQTVSYHEAHVTTLADFMATVKDSYTKISDEFGQLQASAETLQADSEEQSTGLQSSLLTLQGVAYEPLQQLVLDVDSAKYAEYAATGITPKKTTYEYSTALPRTLPHENILRSSPDPELSLIVASPVKNTIYADAEVEPFSTTPQALRTMPRPESSQGGLRELDVNAVTLKADMCVPSAHAKDFQPIKQPPAKRQNTGAVVASSTLPGYHREIRDFSASVGSKMPRRPAAEGRENMPLSASIGVGSGGRVLRSRAS